MKLKTKYLLFIALIHLVALVLSYFVFQEHKLVFIASEGLVLLSLVFAYQLYASMIQPIELIGAGVQAIQDRDFNVKFQSTGQREMDKLIGVYNQMIDRLREERTLQAEQHFFLEKLIQTSPTGILILDFDQKIASANPKVQTLLEGKENVLIGKKLEEIAHPLAQAMAKVRNDETDTIHTDGIKTFKCHKTHFIDRGFPHYFLLIEELTAEKLQIEKQAYGKVIRMMAHEVNNSIGPINSILESLDGYHPYLPAEEQPEYGNALKVARERNERLNQFMRNFADVVRLPPPCRATADLRPLLRDVVALMRYQTGPKTIQFDIQAPERPVLSSFDAQQIEQVLINVIKNAIEAIDQEGTITLRLTEKPAQLKVSDTGAGISADQVQQLFSPFFSTKPDGQGVGLTLAREVLMNHGFAFSLVPNEGKGSTFTIIF